jgi:hypothetical protein
VGRAHTVDKAVGLYVAHPYACPQPNRVRDDVAGGLDLDAGEHIDGYAA